MEDVWSDEEEDTNWGGGGGCLLFKRGQKWVRLGAALHLEHLIPAQPDDLTEGLGGVGVSLREDKDATVEKVTVTLVLRKTVREASAEASYIATANSATSRRTHLEALRRLFFLLARFWVRL